jgi:hypothetical protein
MNDAAIEAASGDSENMSRVGIPEICGQLTHDEM